MNINDQAVLNQVAELDAQIKSMTKKRDDLLAAVDLTGYAAGERVATSVGYLRFDKNSRFDKKRAQEVLDPEVYKGICTMEPNLALAKKVLTGFELEDCYVEGAPKRVFVAVNDFDN